MDHISSPDNAPSNGIRAFRRLPAGWHSSQGTPRANPTGREHSSSRRLMHTLEVNPGGRVTILPAELAQAGSSRANLQIKDKNARFRLQLEGVITTGKRRHGPGVTIITKSDLAGLVVQSVHSALPNCAHFAGAVLHGLAQNERCLETVHHPAFLRSVQQEHSPGHLCFACKLELCMPLASCKCGAGTALHGPGRAGMHPVARCAPGHAGKTASPVDDHTRRWPPRTPARTRTRAHPPPTPHHHTTTTHEHRETERQRDRETERQRVTDGDDASAHRRSGAGTGAGRGDTTTTRADAGVGNSTLAPAPALALVMAQSPSPTQR